MVYLIGGAPRVGKSIIARRLAQETGADLISTDDLWSESVKELTESERKEKYPFPGFSGTASENTLTSDELTRLQLIEAASLWPELDEVIRKAIAIDEPLVIEGVHLIPEYVDRLIAEFGPRRIRAVFVGSRDVADVAEGIAKNTSSDNWMKDANPEVISQLAAFVAAFSAHIKTEAERNRLKYEERTKDFEGDIKTILSMVLGE